MSYRVTVCTAGLHGAGKSVLSEAANSLGFHVVSLGDSVRSELRRRGLEVTHSNIHAISVSLRKESGPEAVAALAVRNIDESEDLVMFDGLRSLEEYNYIRALRRDTSLIAIHASPRVRYARWSERKRVDDPVDFEGFMSRDLSELEFGMGSLMVLADYHLVNQDVTLEEFRRACGNLLKNLKLVM